MTDDDTSRARREEARAVFAAGLRSIENYPHAAAMQSLTQNVRAACDNLSRAYGRVLTSDPAPCVVVVPTDDDALGRWEEAACAAYNARQGVNGPGAHDYAEALRALAAQGDDGVTLPAEDTYLNGFYADQHPLCTWARAEGYEGAGDPDWWWSWEYEQWFTLAEAQEKGLDPTRRLVEIPNPDESWKPRYAPLVNHIAHAIDAAGEWPADRARAALSAIAEHGTQK
jgi:hypothetical protein